MTLIAIISVKRPYNCRSPNFTLVNKAGKVANGGTSSGNFVTSIPFPQLSKQAAEADTFTDFSSSLLSVGKMADDGNISISREVFFLAGPLMDTLSS